LNATLRRLDVSRPDMYYKISVARDMHDLLMIPQAEVTTHDLLTRPPIAVFSSITCSSIKVLAGAIHPNETSADSVDRLNAQEVVRFPG
jgi:hypothetical protein